MAPASVTLQPMAARIAVLVAALNGRQLAAVVVIGLADATAAGELVEQ